VLSGLAFNPANATALADGSYLCSTGEPTSQETNIYTITTVGSAVTLSDGGTCTDDVVIPEGVTAIKAYYSFTYNSSITSITIPSSVASIGDSAFSAATALRSVSFADGSQLTSIEESAFWGTVSLNSINIPIGVISIGEFAFNSATSLSRIYFLGSAPATVGDNAFTNIASSPKAYVNAGNTTSFTLDVDGKWNGLIVKAPIADGTYSCTTGALTSETTNIYTITTAGSDVTFSSEGTCTGDVVIPEGVTTTSSYTFGGGSSQVTSVSLPESMNQVGFSAFYGTGLLTEINVAPTNAALTSVDGVLFGLDLDGINATLIAYPASRNASTYTTPTAVSFAGGPLKPVTSISGYAFQGAQKLTTLNISEGVTTLGNGIAESTQLLSVINLPATYTEITGQPFQDAWRLTSITINASVVTISNRAFVNAYTLSNIYFLGHQPTVDDNGAFIGVPSGAKAYVYVDANGFDLDGTTGKWKGLTVVDLAPDGDYVCSTGSKTTVETPSSTPRYKITGGVVSDGSSCADTVVIPDGIKAIGNNAFEAAATLTSITIPAGVISIGDYAFFNTTALTSFTVAGDNPNYSATDGVLFNKTGTTLLNYPVGKTATSYSIPSGVTSIGNFAFYDENSLISITIPTGVTSIGNSSFRNTASLTAITLPASLNSIGEDAFSFATALTSITLPADVASIGSSAFGYAGALTSIYFLGDAPTVGTDAFANIAPSSNAYIRSGNTTFTPVVNGKWNSLTVAFFNVVTYDSNGGSEVSASPFAIGGIISAPTAPTRGGYGFAGWSLTDGGAAVTFPYAPDDDADFTLFANWLADGDFLCSGERVTDESTNIFTITDGVVSNGNTCTGDVVIPEGVNAIAGYAFYSSVGLSSISLPATLSQVATDAFYYIPGLTEINVASTNAAFTSVDGVLFGLVSADAKLIAYPANRNASTYITPTAVSFAGGSSKPVTSIEDYAFKGANLLTSITISAGVTRIGDYAFEYATQLASITIPAGVTYIGDYAFSGSRLTSVTIPAGVTRIGYFAFSSSSLLSSVYFLGNAPTVGSGPFDDIGPSPKAFVKNANVSSFTLVDGNWNGLTVEIVDPPAPDNSAAKAAAAKAAAAKAAAAKAAAADLVKRTINAKKKFTAKTLAKKVGVKIISKKATVSVKVPKSSQRICIKSGSKLKTLKAGKCVVTFTVQEPKPKKGKKPKATKTVKTLVVQ